jgi:hypothetical protein
VYIIRCCRQCQDAGECYAAARTVESATLRPAGSGVAAARDAAGLRVEQLCALHFLRRGRLHGKVSPSHA